MAQQDKPKEPLTWHRSVYIDEVQGHQDAFMKFLNFTYSATKAAGLMLAAAVIALVATNAGAYELVMSLWGTELGFMVGSYEATMTLGEVINDVLMAVFFLLVGLEIKYEMTAGDLVDVRQALLPIIAAVGGVVAPIGIYMAFNGGIPETSHGWGVPTATDIAFALGILSLLGSRVPSGVRVFLSTLAVADDIIAIIVIAVFYGHSPSLMWLGCVAVVLAVLVAMNRRHVYSLAPYLAVGVVLWYCVFMSGVHSTIAGVLLAFTIPAGSRIDLRRFVGWSASAARKVQSQYDPNVHVSAQEGYLKTVSSISHVARQVVPPATRLEHKLYPWVYFGILPLFALANADVYLGGTSVLELMDNPVFFGVFLGLLVGKPLGILLFSFVVVKLKVSSLPENTSWMHLTGAAILGGVGFTMAIFVANLAFPDAAHVVNAKLAILLASATAGVVGFTFLAVKAKSDQRRGVAYLTASVDTEHQHTAAAEAAQHSKELLDAIDSPLVRSELEQAQRMSECGVAEVVVDLGADGRFGHQDDEADQGGASQGKR
ncbi:Na+/H+ antiporter NhaA [Berryella wangjianweii]|uniref:Na(+)/H(+) antiporter NhaA n=1 Tax=Berryella wangjianweii TaxID=2734634 RepID=A0A6M8J102_9ACTN|nr:Na+/H+ antiporter NhaA [Berryella wangjianweii]NPD31739.1 Na+/H+ antiporter NhaA [Eggerthellaceae bacterium zg-997]QKF07660.1 Na+/H+ antiporter NhaA [Berryella wangjianweii]